MKDDPSRKSLSELTDDEVQDIVFGNKTHPVLQSPMADAAAGYLMYRMVKPVLKFIATRAIPFVAACGIAGAGAAYGHDWLVENTEVGAKIGQLEERIAESDAYKGFSEACGAVGHMRSDVSLIHYFGK